MLQRSGNLQLVFHDIWLKHFVNLTWIYVRYHSVIVGHNQKKTTCIFQVKNIKWSTVVFYTKCIQLNVSHKINLVNLLMENGVWYFSNVMLSCGE